MSVGEWKISKPTKFCHTCGRPVAAGKSFFSALQEDEQRNLFRLDYCIECWQNVERNRLFSYWKARPREENRKKRRVADDAVVLDFFWQLEEPDTEQRKRFRFALALYLMRRKIFKLKEIQRSSDGERILLSYPKGGKSAIEIDAPELSEESIQQATRELQELLDIEM